MWTKFGLQLQKKFEMRTSGGGVVSDFGHTPPDEGGRGGQKRANFCGRPLWMAPKLTTQFLTELTVSQLLLSALTYIMSHLPVFYHSNRVM